MRTIYIFSVIAIIFLGGYGWLHWRSSNANAAGQPPPRRILYWVDPMHPSYKSDKPGIAPDCGMKLEPVYEEERKAEAAPGRTIHVSPEMQQMVGVRSAEISWATSAEAMRAPGRVVPDETRITRVYPHMEGWVSRIFVDFNGQMVKKGDLLLTVYSPEVVAAEQELLLALRVRDQMQASPVKEAWGNSELLVQAARRRLEVFDLTPAQIGEIEQMRSPLEGDTMQELFSTRGGSSSDSHASGPVQTVAIYSPASGFVTARNAYPSQRVTTETELYALTDLSHVWIMADVFENDIAGIHVGQSAMVHPPNGPAFTARVSYVQPQVDPQTRTAKVRLESANEDLRLKPDMFVSVQFPIGSKRALMVPADAVMDTGTAQTVYVDRGEGNLEPRAVHIGGRVGDQVEILAGLHAGERIVTSGTFLIDSESRLHAGGASAARPAESH